MATNNPYPWVMPSVAVANGYAASGGGGQDTSFDPTNPGRRKRRPGVSGDDGGIGGAINAGQGNTLQSPASVATAGDDKSLAALGDRLKSAYGFDFSAPTNAGSAAPAAAPISPLQLAQSARATASPLLRRGEFFPATIDSAPTTPAETGRIPATPPPVTVAGAPAASQTPQISSPVAWGASVNQMRGAGAAPAVSPNALVDQGVTLPDGRKLSYGAMVNGVPTFSDGSGGMPGKPGTIPRTMTQDDIKALGDRLNVVPATAFTAAPPAFNSADSEANIANILRSRQGGKFGITPEMNAAADLAAVTNQDPRSTLGLAAMNAGRRAAAAPTVLQRKAALDDLAGLQAAVRANALATTQGQNALATANAEGQNALQRTNLGGQFDLAGQRLRNEGDLARADLTGQYGIAAALAKPNAATSLDPDKVNSDAVKLLPQVMGLDPAGQVTDPTTGKTRPPTQAEIAQGLQTARAMLTGQAAPAAASGAQPPVSLDQFMAAAKQAGSKMSDADLRAAYQQRVAALQRSGA